MSRRTAIARAPAAMLLLAILIALGAWDPVRAGAKRVIVQGRVVSESGAGLAGWPVELIATRRHIELGKFTSGGQVVTAARAATDAHGYYSIDVAKDRHYQFWFVRFADPDHLDPVKYLPPADVEITKPVRRGRLATVDKTIRFHPAWPEVRRRIAAAGGEATPKGKILRSIGLPEKISVRDASGGEEWWYFTKGIVYTFRGDEPAGTRRFEPVKPPASGGRRATDGRVR